MVKSHFIMILTFAVVMAAVLAAQTPPGTDWPQWRGPDRTGVSKESGLMKQWPASGLSRIWSVSNLGAGYGSIALKGDRIFVQSLVRSEERRVGKECRL